MQVETVRVTVTLTGCKRGVGVGLDKENVVDMLKPGMPAIRALEMGDRVVTWNGQEMGMVEKGKWKQRPLRDVVKSGIDTHNVVVERAKTSWSAGLGYEAPEWQQGNSWDQGGGSSGSESTDDPPDWASPLG